MGSGRTSRAIVIGFACRLAFQLSAMKRAAHTVGGAALFHKCRWDEIQPFSFSGLKRRRPRMAAAAMPNNAIIGGAGTSVPLLVDEEVPLELDELDEDELLLDDEDDELVLLVISPEVELLPEDEDELELEDDEPLLPDVLAPGSTGSPPPEELELLDEELEEDDEEELDEELELPPVVLDTAPVELDTAPVELDTAPVELDTAPVELETLPELLDTAPVLDETAPVELDTLPDVVDEVLEIPPVLVET